MKLVNSSEGCCLAKLVGHSTLAIYKVFWQCARDLSASKIHHTKVGNKRCDVRPPPTTYKILARHQRLLRLVVGESGDTTKERWCLDYSGMLCFKNQKSSSWRTRATSELDRESKLENHRGAKRSSPLLSACTAKQRGTGRIGRELDAEFDELWSKLQTIQLLYGGLLSSPLDIRLK